MHLWLTNCFSFLSVESFDNPIEALCALCSKVREYDLVVADLHMIAMPGFNLVERVAKGMRIPVISK